MRRQIVSMAVAVIMTATVSPAADPLDFGQTAARATSATVERVSVVPEEAVMVLVGAALLGLAAAVRRSA
jgi:hypothetical protein